MTTKHKNICRIKSTLSPPNTPNDTKYWRFYSKIILFFLRILSIKNGVQNSAAQKHTVHPKNSIQNKELKGTVHLSFILPIGQITLCLFFLQYFLYNIAIIIFLSKTPIKCTFQVSLNNENYQKNDFPYPKKKPSWISNKTKKKSLQKHLV